MELLVRERADEPWLKVNGAYRTLLRAVTQHLQILIASEDPDEEVDDEVDG